MSVSFRKSTVCYILQTHLYMPTFMHSVHVNKLRIQDDFLLIKIFYFITKLKQYIQTSTFLHLTRLSTYKVQS